MNTLKSVILEVNALIENLETDLSDYVFRCDRKGIDVDFTPSYRSLNAKMRHYNGIINYLEKLIDTTD